MFHLITGLLMGVVFVYLFVRCIAPLSLRPPVKIALSLCLLTLCFKLQIFRSVFGISVAQEIPRAAIILAGGLFAFTIVWLLLSLALDSVLLARYAVRRLRGTRAAEPHRPALRVTALVLCAALLTGYGVYEAVRVPDIRRVEIAIPHLPKGLNDLRLVQLSDTHITRLFDADWTRKVVSRVNALVPDLILITGDLIDGSTRERALDVAPLAHLRARYGVYACLGNHEYYSGLEDWLAALYALGIRVLANSHTALTINGETLVLGGVTDPTGIRRRTFLDKIEPDELDGSNTSHMSNTLNAMDVPNAARAFAGSPEGLRILMAHQPDAGADMGDIHPKGLHIFTAHQPFLIEQAARHGVALQLSGHTHGGQIWPISYLVALFNKGFLAGLYRVGDTQVYVSRGAGLWGGFPLRLGAPSEITEIILR